MKVLALYLSGRCANGAGRDSGVRNHAVEVDDALAEVAGTNTSFSFALRAVCGAAPGRRSGCGWSLAAGAEPDCPRCITRLARRKK